MVQGDRHGITGDNRVPLKILTPEGLRNHLLFKEAGANRLNGEFTKLLSCGGERWSASGQTEEETFGARKTTGLSNTSEAGASEAEAEMKYSRSLHCGKNKKRHERRFFQETIFLRCVSPYEILLLSHLTAFAINCVFAYLNFVRGLLTYFDGCYRMYGMHIYKNIVIKWAINNFDPPM